MAADTTEKGPEDLIIAVMTGEALPAAVAEDEVLERPAVYAPGTSCCAQQRLQ